MILRVRAFIPLAVIFCIAANGLAWAAHIDMPAPAESQASGQHAHLDAGDLVDSCDHCCHAGAHLLALTTVQSYGFAAMHSTQATALIVRRTPPHTNPPYIPPIA